MSDEQIYAVEERMKRLWARMTLARRHHDWALYWSARSAWLAAAQLHSQLVAREREAIDVQLKLVDDIVGRSHDAPPAA